MNSVSQVVKSIVPKLIPFFKTVAVYFVVFITEDKPSILAAFVKCLPILCLVLFVYLHKVSLGSEYKYSKKILIGLIFCCIGDACLIWPHLFDLGMVAFAVGHCFYISAFGFKPRRLSIGIFLFILAILGSYQFIKNVNAVLAIGIPIYSVILAVMLWRAIARVNFSQKSFPWASLCGAVGAISFACSDFVIGLNKFAHIDIPHYQVIIMAAYYFAQLGISLSIEDEKFVKKKEK